VHVAMLYKSPFLWWMSACHLSISLREGMGINNASMIAEGKSRSQITEN